MSEARSESSRRYADGEFAHSETDCVSVKLLCVRMRMKIEYETAGSCERARTTAERSGAASMPVNRPCRGENQNGFVLQFAATGEHGGIR